MPVDYRMIAETPYISIPEIGNALMQRQQMQNNPLQQMRQAEMLKEQQYLNRINFIKAQEAERNKAVHESKIEELMNMGATGPQAAAAAANIPAPPPAAANAFTGVPGPPAAAPAPAVPWALPISTNGQQVDPSTGRLMSGMTPEQAAMLQPANALTQPPPETFNGRPATPGVVPVGGGRIPYSPEAEGQYMAREGARMEAMKEARDTFKVLLKSAADLGADGQPMMDSLLRAAKKSNALRDVVGFLGDPDGPENQRLVVTGKGETQTESAFTSKEQFAALIPMAGNEIVRKSLENATPGTYEIKTKGYVTVDGKQVPKIVGFKAIASTEAAHTSDIGKLIRERDAKKAALVAAGNTPEEAEKNPDVLAYNAKIAKTSEPKPEAPKEKYLDILQRVQMNDPVRYPVTAEEKKFAWAYEREKKLGAEEYGRQRLQMVMEIPVSVYDANTGTVALRTRGEINEANRANQKLGIGDRYVGAELATKLKSRNAIMEEIATSSEIARKALKSLKHENFSQSQLLKFADQLRVNDDGSLLKSFISSNFAKTLTPEEIEYVTAIRNLRESSFSLRTVGGMGQGSDMLRAAIAEMIPSTRTPNKKMGLSALDKFDIQVDRLWSGIPGIGSEATTRRKDVGKASAGGDIAPAGTKIKTKDGKILTSDGVGGWK